MYKIYRFTVLCMLFFLSCSSLLFAEKVLYVNTQDECDNISKNIHSYLNSLSQDAVETITVYFSAGTYKFNNGPFSFTNWKRPNVRIHFTAKGNDVVNFIGGGNEYTPAEAITETTNHYFVPLKGAYNRGEMYVDQNFKQVQVASTGDMTGKKIHRAASRHETVRVVQEGKYSIDCIRFKLPAELSFLKNKDASYFKNSLICFKIWFGQSYGTIEKTDNEYIYIYYHRSSMFQAVEYAPEWDSFKGYILFYITNVTGENNQLVKDKILVANDGLYIPKGITRLYECKRQLMGWFYENSFKEIKFSKLNFSGASNFDYGMYNEEQQNTGELLTYDGISYYRAALMSFYNTDYIVFEDCIFRNIGSHSCVSAGMSPGFSRTSGFVFRKNNVYDIGGKAVGSHLTNTTIDNNTFHNIGQFYSDRPDVITMTCENYKVTNNRISDFTGNGLTIGYNTCTPITDYAVGGVTEGNELFYTSEFLNNLERYTMEDVYAIYYLNHHVASFCRGNVIHDFEGYKFADGTGKCNNKAIGIDCAGGYNIQIIGNLVFNVADLAFSTAYDSNVSNSATNVYLENNVFFSLYRILGNPNDPRSCKVRNNYIATNSYAANNSVLSSYQQDVENVEKGNEITDHEAYIKDGKCYLKKDFSSLNLSSFVRQWALSVNEENPGNGNNNPGGNNPGGNNPGGNNPGGNDPGGSNGGDSANENAAVNNVWATSQAIHVRLYQQQQVDIYTLDGRLVKTETIDESEHIIPIASGFYMVRLGDGTTRKVYVK